MTDTAIAALIREVLAEELARLKAPGARPAAAGEAVTIGSDADLKAFARKVLKLAADPVKRRAIEQGTFAFELARGASASPASSPAPAVGSEAVIARGFLSERQIDRLPRGTERIVIGKTVKLTPLARDRLRQRGIRIERMDT